MAHVMEAGVALAVRQIVLIRTVEAMVVLVPAEQMEETVVKTRPVILVYASVPQTALEYVAGQIMAVEGAVILVPMVRYVMVKHAKRNLAEMVPAITEKIVILACWIVDNVHIVVMGPVIMGKIAIAVQVIAVVE